MQIISDAASDGDGRYAHDAVADVRRYWDSLAAEFDEEPDHGLRAPHVYSAWNSLLEELLPSAPSRVLDIGCGTGSLSVLLATQGHRVTGIDLSPAMLALACEKTAATALEIDYCEMDAAQPVLPAGVFDVLVARHLLWSFSDPASVLRRWLRLLKPDGRLLLVEGFWSTGAGLHREALLAALPASMTVLDARSLSEAPDLWGGPVDDERYVVVAVATADG